jgi:hypothetical protein
MTLKEAMQLMRDLGSPYQGIYDQPNWVENQKPKEGQ